MPVYSTRTFLILISVSLIVGVAAGALMPPALSHINKQPPQLTLLRAQNVLYIPSNGSLFNQILSRMNSLGIQATPLNASKLATNETLRIIAGNSLVMMDGNWIWPHVNDNNTLSFFKTVVSQKGKLVALGGTTQHLFDAVKNAGAYACPGCHNPWSSDPPVAGFRLKTIPNDPQNWFPALLSSNNTSGVGCSPACPQSNSTDVDGLLEGIDTWLANRILP